MAEWSSEKPCDVLLDAFTKSAGLSTELNPSTVQPYKIICEGNKTKFICNTPDCSKIFRFKSEIERHIFTHSDSRPFLCSYEGCGKAFKRANALQNHVRSQHTGEATLQCPFPNCGMSFTTTAKLRYHKALHLDEKPYKCSFPGCERAFVTFSQLKQHEKSTSVHLKKEQTKPAQNLSRKTSTSTTSEDSLDEDEDQKELVIMENTLKKVKVQDNESNCKDPFHFQTKSQCESPKWTIPQEIDEIEKFFARDIEGDGVNENGVPSNVLSENERLKKKLESTERLLDRMTVNLSSNELNILEDFQNRISSSYDHFVCKTSGFQDPFEPVTKDIDTYFLENGNSGFGSYFNANRYLNGIFTCNDNSLYNDQDLFNFTCENLSSLLFK